MKQVELTKENIPEVFANLYNNESNHDAAQVIPKYCKEFEKIDMELPKHDFLIGNSLNVVDPKKAKIEEKFILYKSGRSYNCFFFEHVNTGERFANMKEAQNAYPDSILVSPGGYKFSHFKYCEKYDIIICKRYSFARQYNKEREIDSIQLYQHPEIAIVTRDKQFYVLNPESNWNPICKSTDYSSFPNNNIYNEQKTNLVEEVKKMFGQTIFNMGANKFISISDPKALEEFGKYKAKLEIKSGPAQEKINKLVAKKLPDITINVPENYRSYNWEPYSTTAIQKVEDGTCVIRWVLKDPKTNEVLDGFRIYVEGKNLYACKTDNKGSFIRTTISNINFDNFYSLEMLDINPDDLKGTLLEYYGSIINDIPKTIRSLVLFAFIKEPKLEQVFKLGLGPVIYTEVGQYTFPISAFESIMGINYSARKEKNIFKYLDLNSYTVNKIAALLKNNEKIELGKAASRMLKSIYGDGVVSLDNVTIDRFFEVFEKCDITVNFNVPSTITNTRLSLVAKNNPDLIKNFEKMMIHMLEQSLGYQKFRTYQDYILMVLRLDDFRNFKINFDTYEEIVEAHNAASAIYNLKRYEYSRNAFKEQLNKVKKLVYENKHDEFCVVIPEEPGDLAKEGLELHHCVKSYIDRVADGRTNIVFIRKKTDKEKPFFTVEVSNEKSIEQVHGFGNRNANTEPGLETFIANWAKEKELTIHGINKIR